MRDVKARMQAQINRSIDRYLDADYCRASPVNQSAECILMQIQINSRTILAYIIEKFNLYKKILTEFK